MTIYLLKAVGSSSTFPASGRMVFFSKRAFVHREAAEAHIPDFTAKCAAGGLRDPDAETLQVIVVELELE